MWGQRGKGRFGSEKETTQALVREQIYLQFLGEKHAFFALK